jgi:hypothetical protein
MCEPGSLDEPEVKDEDWPLIAGSKDFGSNCYTLEDYRDRDVQLIFVHHHKNFLIHSQIAKMHSPVLASLIEGCDKSHMVDNKRIVILARIPDDSLSLVAWHILEDVLKAMYDSHGFHSNSKGYNLGSWRQVMQISHFLDLRLLVWQFKRDIESIIDRYPQGPWGGGQTIHAHDLIAGDLGIEYNEKMANSVYQMMANARCWEDVKTQRQLESLFPCPQCCHLFQQHTIPRLVSLQIVVNKVTHRILKENNDDSFLIKTEELLETLKGSKKDDPYIFNMIYNHAVTCSHCKQLAQDKKRKREQEEKESNPIKE